MMFALPLDTFVCSVPVCAVLFVSGQIFKINLMPVLFRCIFILGYQSIFFLKKLTQALQEVSPSVLVQSPSH